MKLQAVRITQLDACFECADGVENEYPFSYINQQLVRGVSMIQARKFEKATILGLIMISIMIFSGVAPAQTNRTRPRIDSNDPANYRYAYQHGYKAGYEDGFVKGKTDFNGDVPRDYG